ncbi:MAG: hypothetical protein FWE90_06245 [Defluviitaleaceae bacterium]|nr:hypothetical protein [Defluviitaleaceae bacterium]
MQTEKKGFTKREKKMLFLLVFFGFTALMVMYVIIPLNNRQQDERERLGELTLERMQMQAMLNAAPFTRSNHAAAIEQFDDARSRFLNESHISGVGRMLTLLCGAHNLAYTSQSLTQPTVPAQWDAFLVMQASMTLSGAYDDFMRLLDTVERTEYLRVTRVSFGVGSDHLEGISINFEVIMMRAL